MNHHSLPNYSHNHVFVFHTFVRVRCGPGTGTGGLQLGGLAWDTGRPSSGTAGMVHR